jgi:hypothetical protein
MAVEPSIISDFKTLAFIATQPQCWERGASPLLAELEQRTMEHTQVITMGSGEIT